MAGILDIDFTTEMVRRALMDEAEKAAWDIWIAVYPNFNEETFIPFSDFKDQQITKTPAKSLLSFDEIETELSAVVAAFEERKRGE